MASERPVAMISGASRGLGFECARQLGVAGLRVVLTARDGIKGKAAADKLQSEGLDVACYPLDVTREESRTGLMRQLAERYGQLDVLVNNAAPPLAPASDAGRDVRLLDAGPDPVREGMEVSLYGPLRLAQLAVPLMRRRGGGRIVNISSPLARSGDMRGGYPAHRLSRSALDTLTRILAVELRGENILVNAADPGWIGPDAGGGPTRSRGDAAADVVRLATLADDGATGALYQDGAQIPW